MKIFWDQPMANSSISNFVSVQIRKYDFLFKINVKQLFSSFQYRLSRFR